MNSGARRSHHGAGRGGKGLINVHSGGLYQTPLTSVFSPASAFLIQSVEGEMKLESCSVVRNVPFVWKKRLPRDTCPSFAKKSPAPFYFISLRPPESLKGFQTSSLWSCIMSTRTTNMKFWIKIKTETTEVRTVMIPWSLSFRWLTNHSSNTMTLMLIYTMRPVKSS